MKSIAIRGNAERGADVIALLKEFGGEPNPHLNGADGMAWYGINPYGNIERFNSKPRVGYVCYTLEDFERQHPFKVGDEVVITLNAYQSSPTKITERFLTYNGDVKYKLASHSGVANIQYFQAHQLKFARYE